MAAENEIRAGDSSPRTGEIKLSRLLEVVERVTLDATEISLKDGEERIRSRSGRFHR